MVNVRLPPSLCCLCTHCRISEDCVEVSEQFYSNPSQWLSTHHPTTDSAPSHIVLFEGMMKVIVKVYIKVKCWCDSVISQSCDTVHYYTGRRAAVSMMYSSLSVEFLPTHCRHVDLPKSNMYYFKSCTHQS